MSKMTDGKDSDIITYDVVMIGAGPSSLAAAIYTTREDLKTVLVEKAIIGGLAAITDRVDNYPGFAEGLTGMELAQSMEKQAERFGAIIEFGEVESLERDDKANVIKVKTVEGKRYVGRSVLIGTGTHYRQLGIPGEQEFYGKGVHYCATCDGAFYRDKKLVIIGGGNSAIQEGIFLTRYATKIDILVRGDSLKASEILIDELQEYIDKGQIEVHFGAVSKEIVGEEGKVIGVLGADKGKEKMFECDGVFVFIGLIPNTQFLGDSAVELDEFKFVKTDIGLMTDMKGVFASGDCRSGATMQIASAVGEGATAALMIRKYLESKK